MKAEERVRSIRAWSCPRGTPGKPAGQAEAAENPRLGLRIAERVGRGAQPGPQLGAADLVDPFPADLHPVTARVGGADRQRRLGDLGRRERAVGGGHGGHPAQPRVVLGEERGLPGLGHHQPLVDQGQMLELGGHRVRQPGQPEPGELAVVGLAAVGVDDAVALAADEAQRDRVGAVGGLDHRGDQQRGLVAGHVQGELGRARRRHGALLSLVDERQPDLVGLVEHRPELVGLAAGEVQVLLVAAVPAVGVARVVALLGGARPVKSEQLVQQADVRGRELVPEQHVVEPGPGQVARHPAADSSRLHQPGLELELAGGVIGQLLLPDVRRVARVAAVLGRVLDQGELDRERRDGGSLVGRRGGVPLRGAEQRVERLLPRQRRPAGGAARLRGRCRVSSVAASTRAATCTQSVPTAQLQYPRRNRSGNPLEARNEADTVLISPPPSLTVPVSSCCEASQAICTIAPRLTAAVPSSKPSAPTDVLKDARSTSRSATRCILTSLIASGYRRVYKPEGRKRRLLTVAPGEFELGTDGPSVILAGVDESVTASRAGSYAAGLARRQGARLVIVYVQTPGSYVITSSAGASVLAAEAQARRRSRRSCPPWRTSAPVSLASL